MGIMLTSGLSYSYNIFKIASTSSYITGPKGSFVLHRTPPPASPSMAQRHPGD